MAISHAILVTLALTPCSGYDLAKRFTERGSSPVGCFWQATQQQIYRELNKLEAEGAIEAETVIQEGRPNKKIFQVTEQGHQKLQAWMQEPTSPSPIREDLLVKVLGGHLVPIEVLRQSLQERRQVHEQQLQFYRELEQTVFQDLQAQQGSQPSLKLGLQYLTLRRGIRYERDWMEWCEEALAWLESVADRWSEVSSETELGASASGSSKS